MIGSVWSSDGRAALLVRFRGSSVAARFARGAFWSLIGTAVSRTVAQLGVLVAARILGTTKFGELGVVQNTTALFGVFAGLGLGLTATKYVAEYRDSAPERAGRILGVTLLLSIATGVTAAVAVIIAAPWLAEHALRSPTLAVDLRIATGLLLFGAVNGVQMGGLAGAEQWEWLAGLSFMTGLTGALALIAGAYFGGVNGAVLALVVTEIVSLAINQFALQRVVRKLGLPIVWRDARREIGLVWRFSLPALLSSTAVMPVLWLARLLLIRTPAGYAEAGIFEAANKWSLLLLFIPASVGSIQIPLLTSLFQSGDLRAFRAVYRTNIRLNLAVCLVPAAVIALCAKPIMALYGTDYVRGWPVLAILALATAPIALNTSLGQVVVSSGSMWSRFGFDVLLGVVMLASSALLIPHWGAAGMAVALTLAYAAASAGLFVYVRRREHVRPAVHPAPIDGATTAGSPP
jgi:O-antigen/teichoic acid export membrane protein